MPYIAHSSDNDRCFDLIASWLENCRSEHDCPRNDASTLPTRVIDVDDETTTPLLLQTNGQKGGYVAISYVWGATSKGITLEANFAERLIGMPLDSLCKTHQDAITITRRLGFKYLWIDALCIIQDSRDYWEKEAAQMFDIYRRSVLTLAATSSNGGDEGIFLKRPIDVLAKVAIICGLRRPARRIHRECYSCIPKLICPGDYEDTEDRDRNGLDMLISKIEFDPASPDPDEEIDTGGLIQDAEGFNGPFVLVRRPVLSHGLYSHSFHTYWSATDFPLEDRAWCFQERILST
jgi:hypothetical protein